MSATRVHPIRLMMTAFGWNDSGGGTIVPRALAVELARRGWDVTVFHAAVDPLPGAAPYTVREFEEDGVRLLAVHNRTSGRLNRDIDEPAISAAFAAALARLRPDAVHFHNLYELGASLIDHAASHGVPAYLTPHNYWLVCPRLYLVQGNGSLCQGPGDGARCAACHSSPDTTTFQSRLAGIRARASTGLTAVLSVSHAVRQTLLAAGYDPEAIDVVRQAMPHDSEIWERVGSRRQPGRHGEQLTVAFFGTAYPHKGPQLLIEAAQRTQADIRIEMIGDVPAAVAGSLQALDRRGVVNYTGAFAPSEIGARLAGIDAVALPSTLWDCAPLVTAECQAAGVPLLVPRMGGMPESVRDEVDGLTFNGLDADDLARQLDRLASEPGLLERLQSAIEPPRSFSDYVDDLEAYYAGERPGRVTKPPDVNDLEVRWQGDHDLPTSLSIINRRVVNNLPCRVQRVPRREDVGPDGIPATGRPLPLPVLSGNDGPPLSHIADIEVRHQWPPDLRPPAAGRLAVIQPWEFGAVPRAWATAITNHVDELWVPSEFVRAMYLSAGIPPERVVAVPNGVDLDTFTPDGPSLPLPGADGTTRFLFVGGLIWRKGPDVLLNAFTAAFADRDDVTLVVKDFGAGGIYRNGDRHVLQEYAASGRRPRVIVLDDELDDDEVAALYHACDVLVHPYRGEGFAMPVLEAMACGLPVITTAGGPTDEFCPPEAGWRIRAQRSPFASDRVDALQTVGRPWVLEPDTADLIALLREAAGDAAGRTRRGAAAHAAAQSLGWPTVAQRYAERLQALAGRRPLLAGGTTVEPWPFAEDVDLRILATPAWRGDDRLGDLLHAWTSLTARDTSACLYLVADPAVDGSPEELERRVLGAAEASGVALDRGADINVLMEPHTGERDVRLHAGVDAYVSLHDACAGHERLATELGNAVVAATPEAIGELLESVALADAA
jgi:glycosyltransferase involved in cell wall biosynthesis